MMRTSEKQADARDRRQLTDGKREKIRQVIINLFADALFHDVGIRDICARAEVTPKTIYKHFGNKETLLISAIAPDMARLTQDMEVAATGLASTTDRLEAVTSAFISFYFDNLPVARIVFLNIPSAYFVSQPAFIQRGQLDIMADLIKEGQQEGSIRKDVEAIDLVEAVAGIAMRSMFRLLTSPDPMPSADAAATRMAHLVRPLLVS
jgi:TetR/AcrR family transcriptional regulator, fatty acid metabolism regulator protein